MNPRNKAAVGLPWDNSAGCSDKLPLIADMAGLLLANGQTTEGTRRTAEDLGRALGQEVWFTAWWGEFALRHGNDLSGARYVIEPIGVDIGRVMAAERLADGIIAGRGATLPAGSLDAIRHAPPVALARFASMAGVGAMALGIIFGAANPLTLALITGVAALSACVRRVLSRISDNPFLQPLTAAFIAGIVGGATMVFGLTVSHRLVMVCPCMILVPGPHFLNGMIDLARARIPLGAARLAFAGLIVVAICAGLLAGCACLGVSLPMAGATAPVPLGLDVVAAGAAVAAYGTFFNMPWRMLLLPVGIGMLAHALRWELLASGATLQAATFGACLLVGALVTPLAKRLRIPFGAVAFASVVSMIPGVFMFECAADTLSLIEGRSWLTTDALSSVFQDGATAGVVLMAMMFGLLSPKLPIDALISRMFHRTGKQSRSANPRGDEDIAEE